VEEQIRAVESPGDGRGEDFRIDSPSAGQATGSRMHNTGDQADAEQRKCEGNQRKRLVVQRVERRQFAEQSDKLLLFQKAMLCEIQNRRSKRQDQ